MAEIYGGQYRGGDQVTDLMQYFRKIFPNRQLRNNVLSGGC